MDSRALAIRSRYERAFAGAVSRDGLVRYSPNLPGVVELPVRALLAGSIGLPVRVDNDATCALWGERCVGAAQGSDDVALIALGTGIGGGLVMDGRLVG